MAVLITSFVDLHQVTCFYRTYLIIIVCLCVCVCIVFQRTPLPLTPANLVQAIQKPCYETCHILTQHLQMNSKFKQQLRRYHRVGTHHTQSLHEG